MYKQAQKIQCHTIGHINFALGQSWMGENVIAYYNNTRYDLYKDMEGPTHEILMNIVGEDDTTDYNTPIQLILIDDEGKEVESKLYDMVLLDIKGDKLAPSFFHKTQFAAARFHLEEYAKRNAKLYAPLQHDCEGYVVNVFLDGDLKLGFVEHFQTIK